jgi:hypothetical protein
MSMSKTGSRDAVFRVHYTKIRSFRRVLAENHVISRGFLRVFMRFPRGDWQKHLVSAKACVTSFI